MINLLPENLQRAAPRIAALHNMQIILGISRLILLCSKGVKAIRFVKHKIDEIPELTMNIDFIGFMTIATVIMIVQMLIDVPVIQNMNNVMNIYLDGDFPNSQAF